MQTFFPKLLFGSIAATLINGGAYYYFIPTNALKEQILWLNGIALVLTAMLLLAYGIEWTLLQQKYWLLEIFQGLFFITNLLGVLFLSLLTVVQVLGDYHYVPLVAYLVNAWWLSFQSNKAQVKQHYLRAQQTKGDVLDDLS